jgi:hypothetical protein
MSDVKNYPYLAGMAMGRLETLAYTLCSNQLVPFDKYKELQAFLDAEVARLRKAEVDYSEGTAEA